MYQASIVTSATGWGCTRIRPLLSGSACADAGGRPHDMNTSASRAWSASTAIFCRLLLGALDDAMVADCEWSIDVCAKLRPKAGDAWFHTLSRITRC